MSDTTNALTDFFTKNCEMGGSTAKKFLDSLETKGIDGLKIVQTKARNGTLKPVLEAIAKEQSIDSDYVGIILTELGKLRDKVANDQLATKQKEVEAALKAAREYRQAAATQNKETLTAAYAALDAALKRVAPEAGWNVPAGVDLLPQLDVLIKDITSLAEVVASGDYESDSQMLPQISDGALCKAAVFLPNKPIGKRAVQALFKLPADLTKNVLSETHISEATFSSNAVSASYENDITQDGSANTFNAEGGAFFGVGAFGISSSYSGGNASDRAKRINTLTETRQAVGFKVHAVSKASVNIKPDQLTFDYPTEEGVINTVEAAKTFFDKFGTHVIVAPQVLGGQYIFRSTVTFGRAVKESSYTEAVNKTLSVSAGMSGWGLFEGGIFGGSMGGGTNSTTTRAESGGTTSTGDEYTATTNIIMRGPSCVNAASFRASLNNGNKSWCFIDNGLKLDAQNRDNVVNQIVPVWNLFDRVGRKEEAVFLRKAWLDIVVDMDVIINPNSFFSKLVNKVLHVDSLSGDRDNNGWTKPFEDKLNAVRTPIAFSGSVYGETGEQLQPDHLRDLDPHAVGFQDNRALTQFQFHRRGSSEMFYYSFTTSSLTGCGQALETRPITATTQPNMGEHERSGFLSLHTVRAPEGYVLTGFQLESDGIKVWYRYNYTQLYAGNVRFSYNEADVHPGATSWQDGARRSVAYLDKLNVYAGDYNLLVGFHLLADDENMRYEYWYVPVSALKPEVLLVK